MLRLNIAPYSPSYPLSISLSHTLSLGFARIPAWPSPQLGLASVKSLWGARHRKGVFLELAFSNSHNSKSKSQLPQVHSCLIGLPAWCRSTKTGREDRWEVWSSGGGKGLVLCRITGTDVAAPWSFHPCGGVGPASSASSRALVGATEWKVCGCVGVVLVLYACCKEVAFCGFLVVCSRLKKWTKYFTIPFQQLLSFSLNCSGLTATSEVSTDVRCLSINNVDVNVICRWLSSQPYVAILNRTWVHLQLTSVLALFAKVAKYSGFRLDSLYLMSFSTLK